MSVTGDARAARAGRWAGVVAFLLILLLPLPLEPAAQRTAAVAALMSIWWLTEALPLAATALLPLVLFPALGVLTPTGAAAPYANPVVFLFLGGFIVAIAMQHWGLHRRIALAIVARAGTEPHMLVLGFMLATAFISMWISNTATAAMMVPIGIALAELLRPNDRSASFPFGKALLLGIAYAATIGGIATLIGTPPNAVFAAAAREMLGRSVSFTEWLIVGLPVALVLLPAAWALLVFVIFPSPPLPDGAREMLASERRRLGPRSRAETATAFVFATMAFAWLVREPKELGTFTLPGITSFAPGVDDATIAIAGALLLFLLPSGERGRAVLEWDDLRELPWGVLLLFGGGLSLARAFDESGLTGAFGNAVTALQDMPLWLLIGATVALFILLSELASNTAVAAMAMPVLAGAAAGLGQDPLVFMAAGALAASSAFMLPVGTPPNAIAFGSGYITMRDMMRAGLWLNLLAILVVTLVVIVLGPVLSAAR